MRHTSCRGSSIVAVLAALTLVTASLSVYVSTQAQLLETRRYVYQDASTQANTTLYNGWAARGLDPAALQMANGALLPPSSQRKASSLSSTTVASSDRASGVGALRITTAAAAAVSSLDSLSAADRTAYLLDQASRERRGVGGFTVGVSQGAPGQLPPPQSLRSSLAAGATYAGSQLTILDPDSPIDTVLRYTTDGSIPSENSPLWDPIALWSEASIPLAITFRAYHPDTLAWNPSPPVAVNYSVSAGILVSRISGGLAAADEYFTIEQVLSASDGLSLSAQGPSSFTVYYTLDGSDPSSSASRLTYVSPILPWPSGFPSDGVPVLAFVDSHDLRYDDSDIVSVRMRPLPTALPSPAIAGILPALPVGTTLQASLPNGWDLHAPLLVSAIAAGANGSYGSFLPSITLNF